VSKELKAKGLDEKKIGKILDFIKIQGDKKVLDKVYNLVNNQKAKEAIKELAEIVDVVKEFGYDKSVRVDLGLVRGLEYYTGPVFEVAVSGGKLALAGGGRYDNLIEAFGGRKTPAMGISFGFERIMDALVENKMIKIEAPVKLFVVAVNDNVRKDVLKIAQRFRKENIATDFDLGGKNLSKQLAFANSASIPFVLFVGERELKEKKFKLRDMVCGEEKTEGLENIIKKLKST